MADNTIDTLQLKIESDAQQASNGIERLAQTLVNLEKATGKDESSLGRFANVMRDFSKSFRDLDGASNVQKSLGGIGATAEKTASIFKNVISNLKIPEFKESIGLSKFEKNLENIIDETRQMKIAGEYVNGVQTTLYALASAAHAPISAIDTLKEGFYNLGKEVQKTKESGQTVGVLKSTFYTLGRAIQAPSNIIEKFKSKLDNLSKSTKETEVKAPFGNLESNTKNVEKAVDNVSKKLDKVSKSFRYANMSAEEFEFYLRHISVPKTLETDINKLNSKLKQSQQHLKDLVAESNNIRLRGLGENSEEFRKVRVEVSKTKKTISELETKIAQAASELEDETKKASDAWRKNLGKLEIPKITEVDPKKLTASLKRLEADLQKTKINLQNDITMGRIVVDDSGYQKAMEKITLTEKTIEATREKLRQVGTVDTGLEKTASSMSNVQAVANLFSRAISNLILKFERLGKGAINIAINGFKKFGDGIKKAVSNIKKLISAVAKFTSENKKSNASLGISFKTILKYVFGIRSLYMLVRKMKQAFKDGLQNLVQYSGEVNHSISLMTSALGSLKNSLAVAFAPIVNIVAPYLTKFINLLTSAFNAIGRFFAALTGKKIAVQATKFYKDYAESLNGVSGAAKDASKALQSLGIDELNVLNQNEDEGGDGGGVDIEDMFTDVAIEGAISDWAQRIRNAFLAGDWEELGKTVAEMVNAGLQKLYDAIVDITPKVEQALKNFAKAFNAFVEYLDWDLLGRTIGAGINLLVKAFNALTGDDGINFENLGRKLSVGFRGLVDEINWRELGNALGNGFMVAWRILEGFVEDMWRVSEKTFLTGWAEVGIAFAEGIQGIFERVNFGSIGKTLADGFNGIFEIINNFNKKMSDNGTWQEIADNVSNGLNNAIKGIRPIEAAQALGKFVTDLLGTLLEVAEKTPWHLLGIKIGQFLENIPWLTIFKQVTSTITTIIGGLFSGLAEEILKNAERIGSGIADAINFIFGKLDGITEWLKKSNLGKKISDGINSMIDGVNWKENGQKLNNLITTFLNEILVAVRNVDWKKIGKSVGDFLDEIDWKGIFSKTFDIIKETLFGLIGGLEETATGKIGLAIGGMAVAFGGLSKLTPILEAFFGPEGKLYGAIITGVGTLATGLVIGGKDFVNACFDFISGILDKMIKAVDDMDWAEVWHNIVTALGAIISKTPEILGKIKALSISLVTHLVAGLLEYVVSGQVFKDLAEFAVNLIKGIIEGVTSAVGALLEIPRLIFDAIVNGLKTLFGIHSPSTVMAEIGGFIMQGLINGITALVNGVISIFSGIKETIVNIWNGIGDFFSGLWEGIRNTAESAWNGLSNFLSSVWNGISSTANSVWGGIKNFFSSIWDGIVNTAQKVWNETSTFLSNVWNGIQNTASSVWSAIKNVISNAFEGVSTAFSNAWSGIKTFLSTTWESIKNMAEDAWNRIKSTIENIWNGLKENAGAVWNNIKTTIGGVWDTLKGWASAKFESIRMSVSNAWEKITASTKDTWNGVKSFVGEKVPEIVNNIQERFSGLPTFMTDNGRNIISGLMNGINEKTGALKDKIVEVAGNVSGWFKEKLGIHSPSTVFSDIAGYTFQGFINGSDEKKNAVVKTMTEIADSTVSAFNNMGNVFGTIGSEMVKRLNKGVTSQMGIIAESMHYMAQIMKSSFDAMPEIFSRIGSNMMSNLRNSLSNGINSIKSLLGNFASGIRDMFSNVFSGLSFNMPNLSGYSYSIPAYATGGFPENGLFFANSTELVGEFSNGKNAVVNNGQIIAGIEEAAYRGFTRANAESTREESLLEELIRAVREGKTISIDGREIVRAYDSSKQRMGIDFSAPSYNF